jgi:hypothetical protein
MKHMFTIFLFVAVVAISSCTTSSSVAPAVPVNQRGPIANAIAQLQLATPQAALAPLIGTPTPVFPTGMFTAEEDAYLEVFFSLIETGSEANETLYRQLNTMRNGITVGEDNTLLYDAEWVQITAVAIFNLQEVSARLRDIVPPPRLTSLHEDVLSFASLNEFSMVWLIEAIDNMDHDKLKISTDAMVAGEEALGRINAKLRDLGVLTIEDTPTIEDIPNGESALCAWFSETHLLKATRFSSMKKFVSFLQKYGSAELDFVFDEPSIRNELVEALEEFLPYGREFIEKWQQLGSFPGANEFWRKELLGNKQRVAALEKIVEGLKAEDYDMYLAGTEELVQTNVTIREAESAMLVVLDKCTEQVKGFEAQRNEKLR